MQCWFYFFCFIFLLVYFVQIKKMPHKICNNIFLHPGRREYHNIYFYNIIIVQVRYITTETKELVSIGYNRFLFPHSYVHLYSCESLVLQV